MESAEFYPTQSEFLLQWGKKGWDKGNWVDRRKVIMKQKAKSEILRSKNMPKVHWGIQKKPKAIFLLFHTPPPRIPLQLKKKQSAKLQLFFLIKTWEWNRTFRNFKENCYITCTSTLVKHYAEFLHSSPGGAEEFKPSALYIKWKS